MPAATSAKVGCEAINGCTTMRYPVILPRVWLLVAVFQGASTDWRHRPHDLESIVYARGGFSDERRRAADDARQRFADIVPPTMLKLYTDQETRGARLSNSIVRSFYSQGHHYNYQSSVNEPPYPVYRVSGIFQLNQ